MKTRKKKNDKSQQDIEQRKNKNNFSHRSTVCPRYVRLYYLTATPVTCEVIGGQRLEGSWGGMERKLGGWTSPRHDVTTSAQHHLVKWPFIGLGYTVLIHVQEHNREQEHTYWLTRTQPCSIFLSAKRLDRIIVVYYSGQAIRWQAVHTCGFLCVQCGGEDGVTRDF